METIIRERDTDDDEDGTDTQSMKGKQSYGSEGTEGTETSTSLCTNDDGDDDADDMSLWLKSDIKQVNRANDSEPLVSKKMSQRQRNPRKWQQQESM